MSLKPSNKKKNSGAGTNPKPPQPDASAKDHEPASNVFFEATIHARRKDVNVDLIKQLDIDRVPDPKGLVRALITADDCVRLLNLGFEVRLHHAHPIRPLDPALIETNESVRRLLDEKLKGLVPANTTWDI